MTPLTNTRSVIKTCPFDKGFYLSSNQAWGTLKVFHTYQLVLSAAFFILFISHSGPSIFGQTNNQLFYMASASYFFITLFSTLLIRKQFSPFSPQAQIRIAFDIIMLVVLMHASGGITSGLGILLAVSVAAGGLLSGGQCAFAFASLATFAILGEQVYSDKVEAFSTTAYTYAGVLSASFFTISILALVLTKRAEESEKIARQRGKDIHNLEQLNGYLVQHLQSGIIVIGKDCNIHLFNEAAEKFIGSKLLLESHLSNVSTECWQLFQRWLRSPQESTPVMSNTSDQTRLQLRFTELVSEGEDAYTIFFDDLTIIDQQVQQGKLASLGRLTASIAHEIRNPLGAISHAGQLLTESPSIDQQDKRLLEIIHNHSNRVNSIVKSILQLSKNEQTLIEPIQLLSWINEFSNDFKEEFGMRESPIQIKLQNDSLEINFDNNHLKQILDNVCSNALKHGQKDPSKPFIEISVGTSNNSHRTFLTITDNGNGIDNKTALKIFEPFYTTSKTGTGLGLYISNQLAELNHATLNYTPNPNGGSSFTLLIQSS